MYYRDAAPVKATLYTTTSKSNKTQRIHVDFFLRIYYNSLYLLSVIPGNSFGSNILSISDSIVINEANNKVNLIKI